MVEVKFYGRFRDVTGKLKLEVSAAESIDDLIERLIEEFGDEFEEKIFDKNTKDFLPNVPVVVNGRRIDLLNGMETKLSKNDTVAFIPIIAG